MSENHQIWKKGKISYESMIQEEDSSQKHAHHHGIVEEDAMIIENSKLLVTNLVQ